jgi:hypothetical protein
MGKQMFFFVRIALGCVLLFALAVAVGWPSPNKQEGPAMFACFFDAVLHALPYLLGGVFCLFMFYGFWRGLSLRPHGHQPPPLESD